MAGANSLQIVLMDGEGASVTVTSTINFGQPPVTGKGVFSDGHQIIIIIIIQSYWIGVEYAFWNVHYLPIKLG